jgi:outer membrane protein OmpA-like peptidoglycan-associated protein
MFKAPQINGVGPKKGSSVFGNNPFFAAQTKLSVGKTGDPYEKEADAVADKIVQRSENNLFKSAETFFPNTSIQKKNEEEKTNEIQAKPLSDSITPLVQLRSNEEENVQEKCEECEKESVVSKKSENEEAIDIQQKCESCEHEEQQVQKKSTGNENNSLNTVEKTLKSTKGSGAVLAPNSKNQMEQGFGADFSNVRIHNNSTSVKMNRQLGAQAFTNGNDIYFNSGKFNPSSKSGKHLLAHELTHVVQQNKGIHNNIQKVCDNSPATVPSTGMNGCSTDTSRPTHQNTEINYVVGKWAIDASGLAALSAIAAKWHGDARNDTIRIDGFASCDGATDLNWRLSCDRANAVENELKNPSDGSPGIPSSATFNKFAHGETEEFSSTDSIQNRKSLVTLQPTATSVPIVMPTAGPTDFQINRIPNSTSENIFFAAGSAVLTAEGIIEIDKLKLTTPTNVRLIGFASMEESPAIAQDRANAVRDRLLRSPNTIAVVSATGNAAATSTRSDFAMARNVEILSGTSTSTTLDCDAEVPGSSPPVKVNPPKLPCATMDANTLTAFNSALPIANDAMTEAINAANPAHADFNEGLVEKFFGKKDTATLTTLATNLSKLQTHVSNLPAITSCGAQCDTGGCESAGVIAYNHGVDAASTMTLCVPKFKGMHINDQARNLIHESAHGTSPLGGAGAPTEGTKDVAYRHERMMFQLSPEDRLRNSDSYALFALFAKEIKTTGNSNAVPAGISTPSNDTFIGIEAEDEQPLKLALAQLEKRLSWATDHSGQLFGEAQEVRDDKKTWASSWASSYMHEAALRFPVNDPATPPNKPTIDDMAKLAAIIERYKMMKFAVKRDLTVIGLTAGVVNWSAGSSMASDTLFIGDDFFRADPRQQISLLLQALAGATPDIETAFIPAYVSFAEWIHDNA